MDYSKVVVLIVNFQRPEDTLECIRSIENSQTPEVGILVVDNGSMDDSVQQIKDHYPGVTIHSLSENRGFVGGYNYGIEHALATQAEYIFLLNNDTTIDPVAIKQLVQSPWDVSVPKILFYDQPERIWAAGAKWRALPPSIVMNGYQKHDQPRFNHSYALEYSTGCALMAKRQVLEDVGGFDPMFKNYMEDYDFSYRVKEAGYSMGYVPASRVYHKVSQTLGVSSPQRWKYLGRNSVLFYLKDQRFSKFTLYSYIIWFVIRESIKGNSDLVIHFLKGVKEGLNQISSTKSV